MSKAKIKTSYRKSFLKGNLRSGMLILVMESKNFQANRLYENVDSFLDIHWIGFPKFQMKMMDVLVIRKSKFIFISKI